MVYILCYVPETGFSTLIYVEAQSINFSFHELPPMLWMLATIASCICERIRIWRASLSEEIYLSARRKKFLFTKYRKYNIEINNTLYIINVITDI